MLRPRLDPCDQSCTIEPVHYLVRLLPRPQPERIPYLPDRGWLSPLPEPVYGLATSKADDPHRGVIHAPSLRMMIRGVKRGLYSAAIRC